MDLIRAGGGEGGVHRHLKREERAKLDEGPGGRSTRLLCGEVEMPRGQVVRRDALEARAVEGAGAGSRQGIWVDSYRFRSHVGGDDAILEHAGLVVDRMDHDDVGPNRSREDHRRHHHKDREIAGSHWNSSAPRVSAAHGWVDGLDWMTGVSASTRCVPPEAEERRASARCCPPTLHAGRHKGRGCGEDAQKACPGSRGQRNRRDRRSGLRITVEPNDLTSRGKVEVAAGTLEGAGEREQIDRGIDRGRRPRNDDE